MARDQTCNSVVHIVEDAYSRHGSTRKTLHSHGKLSSKEQLCAIKACWDFYFLFTYGNIYLQSSPLWLPGFRVKGWSCVASLWHDSCDSVAYVSGGWGEFINCMLCPKLFSFFSKKPRFLQWSCLGLELGGALEIFLSSLPLLSNDIKQNKFLQLNREMATVPGQTSRVGNEDMISLCFM